MRDVREVTCIRQSQLNDREDAIKALALRSLIAARQAQQASWPCLVRPVSAPRVSGPQTHC